MLWGMLSDSLVSVLWLALNRYFIWVNLVFVSFTEATVVHDEDKRERQHVKDEGEDERPSPNPEQRLYPKAVVVPAAAQGITNRKYDKYDDQKRKFSYESPPFESRTIEWTKQFHLSADKQQKSYNSHCLKCKHYYEQRHNFCVEKVRLVCCELVDIVARSVQPKFSKSPNNKADDKDYDNVVSDTQWFFCEGHCFLELDQVCCIDVLIDLQLKRFVASMDAHA